MMTKGTKNGVPIRKKGKPEEGTIPAEEQRKLKLMIESPTKAETPGILAQVRAAVKAKALDDDLMSKFRNIEIPSAEDDENIKMKKED